MASWNRIITAQKDGWGWKLNFSRFQAREEGLNQAQIQSAFEAFQNFHGVITNKAEMITAVASEIDRN